MTMLGYRDGQEGASYLNIVDFLSTHGAKVNSDLEELWRRIIFSICVSNTDDHLRNHGFLLTPEGWVLSPAYDINPVENSSGLSLNITENDNALDLELATSVAPFFRLSAKKSGEIMEEVCTAVSKWRSIAKKYGLSNSECDLKANAFRFTI